MGDLLFALPLIRQLKKNLPQSRIYVLTFKKNKAILIDEVEIEKIIGFGEAAGLNFLRRLKVIRQLRRLKFDLSICTYPSGLRSAIIPFLIGAKLRCAHEYTYLKSWPFLFNLKIKVPWLKHIVELNLDIISRLGLSGQKNNIDLSLTISEKDKQKVYDLSVQHKILSNDFLIGFHPATSLSRLGKCWPLSNFMQLAKKLIDDYKAKILLFGAKEEVKVVEPFTLMSQAAVIDFTGLLTIKQTYALIKRCHLFISNDSALAHLAAAAGVPTVALFGPTDPRLYSPFGERNLIIRQQLPCSPCAYGVCGYIECVADREGFSKNSFVCKQGDFACMKQIEPQIVFNRIVDLINRLHLSPGTRSK